MFIFYTTIMKIHIYKFATDKIPLNAIPFYYHDTMEDYESVINTLSMPKKNLAKEWYLFDEEKMKEFLLIWVPEEEINQWDESHVRIPDFKYWCLMDYYEDNELDLFYCDDNLVVLIKNKKPEINGLAVKVFYDANFSFRGRLKLMNEYYKKQGYDFVSYNFPIEHHLKPDVWRDEYDYVVKIWATEDYMGDRAYVKKF